MSQKKWRKTNKNQGKALCYFKQAGKHCGKENSSEEDGQ